MEAGNGREARWTAPRKGSVTPLLISSWLVGKGKKEEVEEVVSGGGGGGGQRRHERMKGKPREERKENA